MISALRPFLARTLIGLAALCSHCGPGDRHADASSADVARADADFFVGEWRNPDEEGESLTLHLGADGSLSYTAIGVDNCVGTTTISGLSWRATHSPSPATLTVTGTAQCSGFMRCDCLPPDCTTVFHDCSSAADTQIDWTCNVMATDSTFQLAGCTGRGMDVVLGAVFSRPSD